MRMLDALDNHHQVAAWCLKEILSSHAGLTEDLLDGSTHVDERLVAVPVVTLPEVQQVCKRGASLLEV